MFRFTHYAHSLLKEVLDGTACVALAAPAWRATPEAVEGVREQMRNLELPAAAHDAWAAYCRQLQRCVLDKDPSSFLRWKFVRRAMCLTNHLFLKWELQQLQRLSDWAARWQPALRTPPVGNPIPCLFAPYTVGNAIHLAYHVARWEQWSGKSIAQMGTILEFGAGYGGMTYLARRLGFRGRYLLFDLPQFSALQRFYLSSCNLQEGVETISDVSALREAAQDASGDRIFIANISLSETPMGVREPIETIIRGWDHVLVTYQSWFREIDNRAYFGGWHHSGRLSQQVPMPHIPDYWYLFSKKLP